MARKRDRDRYKDRERQRRAHKSRKVRAARMLGGRCQGEGCNVTDIRLLQFDHVIPILRNDGRRGITAENAHREILSGGKHKYQLLCANCHMIKTQRDKDAGLIPSRAIPAWEREKMRGGHQLQQAPQQLDLFLAVQT